MFSFWIVLHWFWLLPNNEFICGHISNWFLTDWPLYGEKFFPFSFQIGESVADREREAVSLGIFPFNFSLWKLFFLSLSPWPTKPVWQVSHRKRLGNSKALLSMFPYAPPSTPKHSLSLVCISLEQQEKQRNLGGGKRANTDNHLLSGN